MALRKFQKNDILTNTMKAYPSCEFIIVDSKIYHNNLMVHSGARNWSETNVAGGYISLYEYNIDRQEVDTGRTMFAATSSDGEMTYSTVDNGLIYPWIVKTGERFGLGTVTAFSASNTSASWAYDYDYGDIIAGKYPLSASISREFLTPYAGATSPTTHTDADSGLPYYTITPTYRHYYALRNTFEANTWRSSNFRISGTVTATFDAYGNATYPSGEWDKDLQLSNLISIPSIFYGKRIEPGTVSAKWYYTGSLIGELQDTRQNGVLYEVSGTNVGEPAGVILYDQGEIFLTGAWDLAPSLAGLPLEASHATLKSPSWIYFGAGALDGCNLGTTGPTFISAAFGLSFSGSTETQVLTMFANAGRDQANYSNNPTYLQYGQQLLEMTSSQTYEENSSRYIYNTVSSSYSDYEEPFKRQVYVSRIAIYDKHKNLMGIATLADPVLKKEDQDLTFKLRLDI